MPYRRPVPHEEATPASPRYSSPVRRKSRTEEEWVALGEAVILDMVETEHAVTIKELEARASDRVWNRDVIDETIDPGILTIARNNLSATGTITFTTETSRSPAAQPITTWHLPPARGRRGAIETASARKRLLTTRHNGWGERGGAGRGLIGQAGENAVHTVLLDGARRGISNVTGSTNTVLNTRLPGELDNSAYYIDDTDPAEPQVITLMVEVKNTRDWYYAPHQVIENLLAKAAVAQAAHPTRLICPTFLCRRHNITVWHEGEAEGYLPFRVHAQLVLPDHAITSRENHFTEVRDELGYADLILGDAPTTRHRGLPTAVSNHAATRARTWQENYRRHLL